MRREGDCDPPGESKDRTQEPRQEPKKTELCLGKIEGEHCRNRRVMETGTALPWTTFKGRSGLWESFPA